MQTVIIPEQDTLIHIAAYRGGGTYNPRLTVCDMEGEENALLVRTKESPTCPFCIRDSRLPAGVKENLLAVLNV